MEIISRLEDDDTKEITSLLKTFIKTWNDKNLESFGNLFDNNAEFTDVIGQTAIGKEAIVKQHIFPFKNVMKLAILEIDELYMRNLIENTIIISAKWKVTGSITPDEKPLPVRNGVIQIIVRKESESYKIILVHNSDNALPYEKQKGFIN